MVFASRYLPCESCGESVDRTSSGPHECTPERLADFQMFALRDEIASFEARYQSYLRSAHGKFELWLAARQVRGGR
jgi:hypothetical protein